MTAEDSVLSGWHIAAIAIVLIGIGFVMFPPTWDHTVKYSINTDTEAQSSVPEGATVYGQSNMTGGMYNTFTEDVFGRNLTGYYGTNNASQSPEVRQDKIAHSASGGNSIFITADDTLKTLVLNTMQADYVQVDGQYYPVETTVSVIERDFIRLSLFMVPAVSAFVAVTIGVVINLSFRENDG